MNFTIAKECTILSDEEKITFPEVVSCLHKAGIESYYADLLMPNKTFYFENTAFTINCSLSTKKVADFFNPQGIAAAIREIQTGQIKYQEFIRKIMDAGVISYMVFIKGQKTIYFGRKGEQHAEEFSK